MQSSYVLGMAILTMATTPKLLEALSGLADPQLNLAVLIYGLGFFINWLFAFVLWHYYWGAEAAKAFRKKLKLTEQKRQESIERKLCLQLA